MQSISVQGGQYLQQVPHNYDLEEEETRKIYFQTQLLNMNDTVFSQCAPDPFRCFSTVSLTFTVGMQPVCTGSLSVAYYSNVQRSPSVAYSASVQRSLPLLIKPVCKGPFPLLIKPVCNGSIPMLSTKHPSSETTFTVGN